MQNVVHGNLLASQAPNVGGQVFNVAMGQSTSLLNLIAALNKILGTSFEPRFAEARVGDVRDSLADISGAERVLKYAPSVSFLEGLARTVEDLKQRR